MQSYLSSADAAPLDLESFRYQELEELTVAKRTLPYPIESLSDCSGGAG
jgi:hypothetical protein